MAARFRILLVAMLILVLPSLPSSTSAATGFSFTPTNLPLPASSGRPVLAPVLSTTSAGLTDIVTVQPGNSTVTVTPHLTATTFGTPIVTSVTGGAIDVAVADFNSDGKQDVAVLQTADVVVMLGDGTGHFASPQTYAGGEQPHGAGMFYSNYSTVSATDLNNDGKADLVLGESGTECCNAVGVEVLMNAGGTFASPVQYPVGNTYVGMTQVAVTDMNGDGIADIVSTSNDAFNGFGINVQLGKGDGTFGTPQFTSAHAPQYFAVGDLNGDNHPDIVTSTDYYNDNTPRQLAVYLSNGDGTFQTPAIYDVPLNTNIFRVALVDGDNNGTLDVAVSSPSDRNVAFFQNDGTGHLTALTQTVQAHTAPGWLISGDLNGDGVTDLLTTNQGGDPGDGSNAAPDMTMFINGQTQAKDSDHDGIPDVTEQNLAETYAPTLLMDPSEPNYPTNVDTYLSLPTPPSLSYYEQCIVGTSNLTAQSGPLTQANLLGHAVVAQSCGRSASWSPITSEQSDPLTSYGGSQPHETFYLSNVTNAETVGSLDPSKWVTYYHVYPASDGGVMIQYWHFYTYNKWQNGGTGPDIDFHAGDWDASIQVHLAPDLTTIERIWYSRHQHDSPGDAMPNIVYVAGSALPQTTQLDTAYVINGTHPVVMVDSGGHAAFASPADACYYWETTSTGGLNAFGKQVWGDPANPSALSEVSCPGTVQKPPKLQKNEGGTVWNTASGGTVTQAGHHIANHLTTNKAGGPLVNLGEYNPGNMASCNTCVGLAPGNASFHPAAAGVFIGYSGLWGSPNFSDLLYPGYPPRGPVFQGYSNGQFHSWYNEAGTVAWP